jgi:hypothetical protein
MNGNHIVFLSHSQRDSKEAERLRRLLGARRDVRLVSSDDLSAGEGWRVKLRDALVSSDLFVLLASSNSLTSDWVLQELGSAWALEKPILIVSTGSAADTRLPVSLPEHQFARLKDLKHPEDLDPWLLPLKAVVPA